MNVGEVDQHNQGIHYCFLRGNTVGNLAGRKEEAFSEKGPSKRGAVEGGSSNPYCLVPWAWVERHNLAGIPWSSFTSTLVMLCYCRDSSESCELLSTGPQLFPLFPFKWLLFSFPGWESAFMEGSLKLYMVFRLCGGQLP